MRKVALVGVALVAVVDALYLALIESQPSDRVVSLRVPFVAAFIGTMALAGALATLRRLERAALLLLGLSASGLISQPLRG